MFSSGCYEFTTREMEEGAKSLVDFEVTVQDTLQTTSTLFDIKNKLNSKKCQIDYITKIEWKEDCPIKF